MHKPVEPHMNAVSARSPNAPQLQEDTFVPEELIALLVRATETTIADLTERFTARQRANLAVFCYHKAHLRRVGLALAATCDRPALVGQWGTVLGDAIYAQSRDQAEPHRPRVPNRPKVTLATSAGGFPAMPDFDVDMEDSADAA
jgi:hypothetical protein